MDNSRLFVDVPCSGFKMLLSLLTFSAAFAYLVDGPAAKRLGLFLFCAAAGAARQRRADRADRRRRRVRRRRRRPRLPRLERHDHARAWASSPCFRSQRGLGCRTFAGWAIF